MDIVKERLHGSMTSETRNEIEVKKKLELYLYNGSKSCTKMQKRK
jgi:hypothetical protein